MITERDVYIIKEQPRTCTFNLYNSKNQLEATYSFYAGMTWREWIEDTSMDNSSFRINDSNKVTLGPALLLILGTDTEVNANDYIMQVPEGAVGGYYSKPMIL